MISWTHGVAEVGRKPWRSPSPAGPAESRLLRGSLWISAVPFRGLLVFDQPQGEKFSLIYLEFHILQLVSIAACSKAAHLKEERGPIILHNFPWGSCRQQQDLPFVLRSLRFWVYKLPYSFHYSLNSQSGIFRKAIRETWKMPSGIIVLLNTVVITCRDNIILTSVHCI